MSQPPTPYNRIFDFESFSIVNPTTQQPGVQIEGELDAIKTTLTSTISRLSEIQRDDGYLRDSSLDQSTIIPYFFNKLDILFQPVFLKKEGGEMDDAATISWSQTTTLPTNTVSTAVSLNNTVIQGALTYTALAQYLQPWPVSLQHPFGYWNGGTYSDVRKTTTSKGVIELVRYGVGMNTSAPLAITPIGNITISAGEISGPTSGGIFPDYGSAPTPHIDISDIRNGTISISAYGIVFKDGSLQTTRGMPQNEVAQYVTAEVSGAIAGVNASITALIGAAPAALNTLSEIADAINDDENIATTLTNAISLKLDTTTAASTYQPLSGMSSYQTVSGMSSYLTTATAASTYYLQTNPTGYITSSALSSYLTAATASSTYQTVSGMSSYLTTATASSTYQTVSGMSSYLTTSTASTTYAPKASPTFTGTVTIPSGASISGFAPLASPVFTGDAKCVTPATSDNDTSIATTAFVKNQAYLTASLAASTYYLQTNPSGFISDAPSDGSQYARKNAAWEVVSGGGSFLPLAGGTMTGAITFDATGLQNINKGTFDNSTGGYNGISLTCAVGYELNWQGGHLGNWYSGSFQPIHLDSLLQSADATYDSELGAWGFGVELTSDNTQNAYIEYNQVVVANSGGSTSIGPTGITFADATVQTTAIVTGPAGTNGLNGAMNYLDMLTVTSSSAGYYESGGSWSAYYGFMNNSGGWFYNKLNASGVTFKLYINGVYDSSGTGAYNYMSSSGTLVTTPVSGDVVTIFVSDGTNEASIPLVTITI